MTQTYLLLADALLLAHALIVLFNVVSLPLIWLGGICRWSFVRNFYFRAIHLALLAFVAVQALAGEICPLTDWENELRQKAGADANLTGGFIAYWVQRLIFYEANERVFTVAYVVFFGLVVATAFWVKPKPPSWWRQPRHPAAE